jgi:hypothetical protein
MDIFRLVVYMEISLSHLFAQMLVLNTGREIKFMGDLRRIVK